MTTLNGDVFKPSKDLSPTTTLLSLRKTALAVIFLFVSIDGITSGFPRSSSCAIALNVVPNLYR